MGHWKHFFDTKENNKGRREEPDNNDSNNKTHRRNRENSKMASEMTYIYKLH